MSSKLIFALVALLVGFGCKNNEDITPDYVTGKNYFTLQIDGDTREYYVHVPSIYDPDYPTPVVFMLHGTSGDGEKFYNISGWKEVGDMENIITVFPSSWHHCIVDDGQIKQTTKWHVFPGSFEYCSGEVPRDDVLFFREIIAGLQKRFNVDHNRIYLAGFSNGGQMAVRCAVEMSDVFAAITENSGSFPTDTSCIPKQNLPVMFQFGNSDDMVLGSPDLEIPMHQFDSLIHNQPYFVRIINSHLATFHLDTSYHISGDENTRLTATYESTPQSPDRIFHFTMVKGLDHQYPNGTNHWMHGAEVQWAWMKQFSLP